MSLEQVKSFYERLANDEAFRSQIQNVKTKEECSQIVKAAGYDFTQAEYEEYTLQLLESANADDGLQDLDEKELAGVIGGIIGKPKFPWPPVQPMYGIIQWPPIQPMYGVISSEEIL